MNSHLGPEICELSVLCSILLSISYVNSFAAILKTSQGVEELVGPNIIDRPTKTRPVVKSKSTIMHSFRPLCIAARVFRTHRWNTTRYADLWQCTDA
jgi:hypothetical protein